MHLCHAIDCETPVPPKMSHCRRHWFGLPKPFRDAIWATYRPGQERTKDPSPEYLRAAWAAKVYLAEKEGRPVPDWMRREAGQEVVSHE